MTVPRCGGAMTAGHDGADERTYRLLRTDHPVSVVFCGACADAAGRLGLVDRRVEDRREARWSKYARAVYRSMGPSNR